jgi:hypothetical protein
LFAGPSYCFSHPYILQPQSTIPVPSVRGKQPVSDDSFFTVRGKESRHAGRHTYQSDRIAANLRYVPVESVTRRELVSDRHMKTLVQVTILYTSNGRVHIIRMYVFCKTHFRCECKWLKLDAFLSITFGKKKKECVELTLLYSSGPTAIYYPQFLRETETELMHATLWQFSIFLNGITYHKANTAWGAFKHTTEYVLYFFIDIRHSNENDSRRFIKPQYVITIIFSDIKREMSLCAHAYTTSVSGL